MVDRTFRAGVSKRQPAIGSLLMWLVTVHLAPVLALCDAADKPNIVIMTADNLGYGDVGCYGNRVIKTPRLDRLAKQGVRCTDFYTASPTCTVSRACLLTGRYPQRHGLNHQLPGIDGNYGIGLRHCEVLLPQLLKQAGYRTACFGKWNIGFAPGSRPTERGFDEFFGHASGNIDYYSHVYNGKLDLHRGNEPVRVEGYSTDLFADHACEFIRRNAQRPFFVYLPFNAPHYPNPRNKSPGQPCIWQAPKQVFATYGYSPETTDEKQRYRAVVTALDEAIGRVLDRIDECGLTERTLVVFFSDNGAFMLPDRGKEVASNAPLRDGGVTLWEGGIRVPCIVRWPGRLEPGAVCREPIISLDFFAMAAALSGNSLPAGLVIDGRDPTATLAGKATSPHRFLFFRFRKMSAVRSGRFKLVQPTPDAPWQLYDLGTDIAESRDVASEQPEVVVRMRREFEQWIVDSRK